MVDGGAVVTSIVWHACGMAEVPIDDRWMDDVERNRFAAMRYPKRLTEARLGRWTAKNTVALAFGREPTMHALSDIRVRNAPDGAPELYVDDIHQPYVIAMTDRADWAVSALREGPERIGCDLELVEPRSRRFVEEYFTTTEVDAVEAGDHDLMANLIWSAKESSLKVLRTGLRRDTRTVEVVAEPGDGRTWTPLVVDVDGGVERHHGWWRRFGAFVLTVAAAVPVDPPVELIAPSPLASAVPGHAWMDDLGS